VTPSGGVPSPTGGARTTRNTRGAAAAHAAPASSNARAGGASHRTVPVHATRQATNAAASKPANGPFVKLVKVLPTAALIALLAFGVIAAAMS
jgi:hypothetical protein